MHLLSFSKILLVHFFKGFRTLWALKKKKQSISSESLLLSESSLISVPNHSWGAPHRPSNPLTPPPPPPPPSNSWGGEVTTPPPTHSLTPPPPPLPPSSFYRYISHPLPFQLLLCLYYSFLKLPTLLLSFFHSFLIICMSPISPPFHLPAALYTTAFFF